MEIDWVRETSGAAGYALGMSGTYFAGKQRRYGWCMCASGSFLWTGIGIAMGFYSMAFFSFVWACLYVLNYFKARGKNNGY